MPPSTSPHHAPLRAAIAIAVAAALLLALPGGRAADAHPAADALAAPATPVWPAPDLVNGVRAMLVQYYGQRAPAVTPYYLRAPEWDIDKKQAHKDPDTLFEYHGGPGTKCHPAVTGADFAACTGKRLARTFGLAFAPGQSLFSMPRGYYANEGVAQMAGYYALYHAFALAFDAPQAGAYVPADDPAIRDRKAYHVRMLAAYEAHQRDIIVRMFRDTRTDGQFQADLTRSAGALAVGYVRTVQALEEANGWPDAAARKNAINIVAAFAQRTWWEWQATQLDGPRTAGFADLGSDKTYQDALLFDGSWNGTNRFVYDGVPINSLRPAALDTGAVSGLWFDADYAMPGDWWCYSRFKDGTTERAACLEHAKREAKGGTRSPIGSYYGAGDCNTRSATATAIGCGDTNLGSIAEEWVWTHTGGRMAAALLRELEASGDPDTPPGQLGGKTYEAFGYRLGYGVSGWYGADPYDDDMEWKLNQGGGDRPVRTLSAGRHDDMPQNGRYSYGEQDTTGYSAAVNGDTWAEDKQEYPAGMENHLPGPNSLYGTLLFGYALSDKVADGLAPSLFDAWHRNNVDEFSMWVWLAQSSYFRCVDVADPADPRCLAMEAGKWPYPVPAEIKRLPLFADADDLSTPLAFRYLWREPRPGPDPALPAAFVASPSNATGCRDTPGAPWRWAFDKDNPSARDYLIDEGGFGAYNELLQGYGGLMRLLAARYPLDPLVPSEQPNYVTQRNEVLKPWYDAAYTQVADILALYTGTSATDYGYVPDIENSTCLGEDPGPAGRSVLTWQYGTGDSVSAVTIRRAMWYSVAASWYWWYDSGWVDVGGAAW
ncbi:MAG: hypothetical protein IT332_08730 [Ardenticatenales bacterium]|nr:hypothetical protein [Ardenticatenales bacterium]